MMALDHAAWHPTAAPVTGATVGGNAVVRDDALIQGGANLSGNVVVGGDAELAIACGSGTYLLFNPDRGCDGRAGETDINPAVTRFSDAEVAITGSTTTPPTTPPTTTPTTTPTTAPPAGRTCSAALAITGSWTVGFQGEVTWNGSLGAGAKTTFGFLGGGSPSAAALTCAAS
jgi:hypothetical protein